MIPKHPSIFHASKWLVTSTGGLFPIGDSELETLKPTLKIYFLKTSLPDAWDINRSLRMVLGFDSFYKESIPPSLLWVSPHTDLGLVSNMRKKISWESQIRPPRVPQPHHAWLKSRGEDHLCYDSPNLTGCDMPFWTHHFCDILLRDPGDTGDLHRTPFHPGNTAAAGRRSEPSYQTQIPKSHPPFTHSSLSDPAVPA